MGKYPKTYHFSFSKAVQDDDKIQHTLELLSHPMIMTEKIDGSNTMINRNGVYGRSHNLPTKNSWMRPVWNLYYRIQDYLEDGVEIYGETVYGIHSIEYSKIDTDYFFYMFGIKKDDVWLSWEETEFYSELLDIPLVPVLGRFDSDTSIRDIEIAINTVMEKSSELSDDSIFIAPKEGVVVRSIDRFTDDEFATNVIKWVRANHVQTDNRWQFNWRQAKTWKQLKQS